MNHFTNQVLGDNSYIRQWMYQNEVVSWAMFSIVVVVVVSTIDVVAARSHAQLVDYLIFRSLFNPEMFDDDDNEDIVPFSDRLIIRFWLAYIRRCRQTTTILIILYYVSKVEASASQQQAITIR
ncbi:hypothetical protein BLOT_015292 [Blomia tropicalis]|nr:hypothetical protein BLOT_015292 [Blomia tropicalis]